MWNENDNFFKEFLEANDLDFYSEDNNLTLWGKIKKVLGISALGFTAFLFPNLAFGIGSGYLLYAYQKYRNYKTGIIEPVIDDSDNLEVSSIEEAQDLKREKKDKIKGLKKDLKKAKSRRRFFQETSDITMLSTAAATGLSILFPALIPFTIGSAVLHGVTSQLEIKNTQKRDNIESQITYEENARNLLDNRIAEMEDELNREAENDNENENTDENNNQNVDTNDDENTDENDNQNVDTNDDENTDENDNQNDDIDDLGDDDIQFDPAEPTVNSDDEHNQNQRDNDDSNHDTDSLDDLGDDGIQFDPAEPVVRPVNNDNQDVQPINVPTMRPTNRDVTPRISNDRVTPNLDKNHSNINNYQVPTVNPEYEKAVDLYLDSLTVDYGRNRNPQIDEVINKVYSRTTR